jgi:hypothetical protein
MNNTKTPNIELLLSNEDYHQAPGISKSQLDRAAKGFLAWRHPAEISSAALNFGTAFHLAILEPHLFSEQVAVTPEGIDRRTKLGKEQWAAFQVEAEGKILLSPSEAEDLEAMKSRVLRHPKAKQLIPVPGRAEVSVFWEDSRTGLKCKARPDFVTESGVLVDLKTTQDASPSGFARACAKFRYHVQAAWYSNGWQIASGETPKAFVFIAVEKTPPYGIGVYVLAPEALEQGWRVAHQNLETILDWLTLYDETHLEDSGYSEDIQEINLPQWAYYED